MEQFSKRTLSLVTALLLAVLIRPALAADTAMTCGFVAASDTYECTGTLSADGTIYVSPIPPGWLGGKSVYCDGVDGGGTATMKYKASTSAAWTTVTDTAGSSVTCTAECTKTIHAEGLGAFVAFEVSLAGSANPTLACRFIVQRNKSR